MIHDEEFDLVWADPPPRWMESFPLLIDWWGNPIFQRRYVIWRLRPAFGVLQSFLIGIGFSLILNIIIIAAVGGTESLELGFIVSVVLPAVIALGFMSVRFFTSCLIGTPLELRRELFSGMLGAVLATPQGDRKVFIAECMSGLMRGLGALEEVLAMLAGLVIPYLVLMSPRLLPLMAEQGVTIFWWLVLFFLVFIIYLMSIVLITFAAGLYSVIMPIVLTIPATLAHVVLVTLGSLLALILAIGMIFTYAHLEPNDLVLLLLIALLEVGVMALMTTLTVHWGVMAFARARRPGYYEPERCTAAGLLKREGSHSVTFGRSV